MNEPNAVNELSRAALEANTFIRAAEKHEADRQTIIGKLKRAQEDCEREIAAIKALLLQLGDKPKRERKPRSDKGQGREKPKP